MSRKLSLPLLVVGMMLMAAAPASAGIGKRVGTLAGKIGALQSDLQNLRDTSDGQTAAINRNGDRITESQTAIGNLQALVKGVITTATASLTALEKGLTDLAAAVKGPTVGGQLAAAGSKLPGKADGTNTATPDALPAGTVYRQIVVATASYPGGVPAGTPIGARTWVKLAPPATAAPLDNAYSCVGAGVARQIGMPDGTVTCAAANIAATNP